MPRKKVHLKLLNDFWITAGIFSNHYLLERLPQARPPVWPSDEEVQPIYKAVFELYEKNIVGLRKGNEADTERRFIDKVFNKLKFGYLNQNKIPEAERRQVPDYFLYAKEEDADKAFKLPSHKKYMLAISIAESKRWDHNLDQPSSGKGKAPRGTYPHQQIRDYLSESEHIKWGILTNGKEWRLYSKEGRSSKFFEIDIEKCLEDLQKFKYFYVLFRPDAFIKDSSGKCLLDNIFDESLRFQEDVEKDLREKVFKCVEWLGHGFLSREEDRLTKKDLDAIYHHSLILLYRILFVLNAEARGLLPTNPQTRYYKHYGIQRIKDKIRTEKGEFISAKTTLYDDLLALFHLINGDNEKLNKELNIPRYNGGLFDSERHSFLEEKRVGDDVLSEVIYELSYRTDKNGDMHSIDYKGLGERHLGTVYEGLLEYKFTFDNGKVGLINDKGERKATGAYYTPDYIVKYIVENTLNPILKEIDNKINKGTKDDSFASEVLKLNICDPAMGSGHFLVEAVQYLAEEIAYHPTTQLKTSKEEAEDEVNYWKRKIVESCIYGVDIKELAVELAKLSLWLKTVDRSQPLNFLDHHLRCGNSLIGARISDLNYLPSPKIKKSKELSEQPLLFDTSRFKQDITSIIKGFHAIETMPSEKLSDIKEKEKTFVILMKDLNRYREIADLHLSLYFGNNLEQKEKDFEKIVPELMLQKGLFGMDKEISLKQNEKSINITDNIYRAVVRALQSKESKTLLPKLKPLLENSETIAKEKNFFHWELEFPEVFFNEDGSPKENPGFECVIGNPPYVSEARENKQLFEEIKKLPILKNYYQKNIDLFNFFVDIGIDLSRTNGYFSFIIPQYWQTRTSSEDMVKKIIEETIIKAIINFNEFKVFGEARGHHSSILVLKKQKSQSNYRGMFVEINDKNTPLEDVIKTMFSGGHKAVFRLSANKLVIHKEGVKDILEKITSIGNMFIEDETIVRGVDTSPSTYKGQGVFVLNDSEFNNLKGYLNEDELKMIKPFYEANQIDSYYYDINNLFWLIYTDKKNRELIENNPQDFPTIISHLKRFSEHITSDNKPYGLHRAKNIKQFLEVNKIAFVRKTLYPKFALIDKPFFCDEAVYFILPQKNQLSQLYLLAIFNSKVAFHWFSKHKTQGNQLQIDKEIILNFPMPPISFTTPQRERKEFYKEAVTLYRRSKYEDIIKWADYELALGRTDTSHDFLAYLAEQMIELNKAKGNEIKGFVKWLEREIGAEINILANKTAIKEYHDNDFNHLIDVLKKNKNKLSIDPSGRKTQELFEKYFQKSMSVLQPLKEKIKITDNLIDRIVYNLYGLTDEEIRIVEGKK